MYIEPFVSIDHYRTIIHPSLRAFVSQVEGSGSGDASTELDAASRVARKEGSGIHSNKGEQRYVASSA